MHSNLSTSIFQADSGKTGNPIAMTAMSLWFRKGQLVIIDAKKGEVKAQACANA